MVFARSQDDRDHCAGAPCGNGAACYTAQSDYYCHCAPGWQGKNCTLRAAAGPAPPPAPLAPPAPSACVGGAECVRGHCVRAPPAPPYCSCETGYIGLLCDEREYLF